MAVMDLDRVYYCCLYGNNEDEAIIRHIDRDMAYESELVALEEDFWVNHVQKKIPPPYIEDDGALILESVRRCMGPSFRDMPPVTLPQAQAENVRCYVELRGRRSGLAAEAKKLDDQMNRLKALIVGGMGGSCSAVCQDAEGGSPGHLRAVRHEVREPAFPREICCRSGGVAFP